MRTVGLITVPALILLAHFAMVEAAEQTSPALNGVEPGDGPATKQDNPSPGTRAINPPEGMVLVPQGEFKAGCGPDCPARIEDSNKDPCGVHASDFQTDLDKLTPVRVTSVPAFFIDKTEATNEQYNECILKKKCSRPQAWGADWKKLVEEKPDHPVLGLDWYQAEAYCKWAGKRLCSGDEWEKAARGTDGRAYPWGNQPPTCDNTAVLETNYGECDETGSGSFYSNYRIVGIKPKGASPYGVLDMAGNAFEWVSTACKGYGKGKHYQIRGVVIGHPDECSFGADLVASHFTCEAAKYWYYSCDGEDGPCSPPYPEVGVRCCK